MSALIALSFSAGVCQDRDSLEIRKISPGGALLRSAFVPGWGQLYNRKYIKAAFFAAGEGWLAYGIYNDWKDADEHERNFKSPPPDDPDYQAEEFARYEDARDSRNLKMWILSAAIFYSMFDAFVDAHLSDFEQTDKAFEVYLGPGESNDFEISLTFNLQ
jgi:uncharacterized membrane protein YebE (DUF533 family)